MSIGAITRRVHSSKSASLRPVRLTADESDSPTMDRHVGAPSLKGHSAGSRLNRILRLRDELAKGVYDVEGHLTACLPALLRDLKLG